MQSPRSVGFFDMFLVGFDFFFMKTKKCYGVSTNKYLPDSAAEDENNNFITADSAAEDEHNNFITAE